MKYLLQRGLNLRAGNVHGEVTHRFVEVDEV